MADPNKYIIVQSWNTGLTASKVYQNNSILPATGEFPALELWPDTAGAGIGRFSNAPDGCMAYCNGKDACVWAGAEYRCAGFILENSTGTTGYDYSEKVTNTLDDAQNIAVLSINPSYVYIASTRPLQGVKCYVKTANSNAATVAVSYWNGSAWTAVTGLADGTILVAGKTLSQTGSIIFNTTVGNALPSVKSKIYSYWYRFIFTGISATTSIYYVTVDAPFQQIVDLWDGEPRHIASAYGYYDGVLQDIAPQVLDQDFAGGTSLTFAPMSHFDTSDYLLIGFFERMCGMEFSLPFQYTNINPATMTISYWNGSAWVAVSGLNDGTINSSVSFGKAGVVTWNPPSGELEFKYTTSNDEYFYFYKISWNNTFNHIEGTGVALDQVTGIPVQDSIHGFSYPVLWQDRLWLLNDNTQYKNGLICSAPNTVCVFNGKDAIAPTFLKQLGGEEEITCGATLYTRYGGTVYDNLIVYKRSETYLVDGTAPTDYKYYRIAEEYGIVSPGTLKSCSLGYEVAPGLFKHVHIGQAENCIILFDGNSIIQISDDIKNYFDKTKTECIPDAMRYNSEAFYDESTAEYHWLFASGVGQTTLNKEFVYDLVKKKWYEIDRKTGNYLQMGFEGKDSTGNNYTFGGIDTGYIERLEYGNTFDGTAITSQFRIGDIALGGWQYKSELRHIKHIAVSKSTTVNSVTISHYGNCANSASSLTMSHAVKNTTNRVTQAVKSINWGNYTFHSISCSLITSDEPCGYEPIGLQIRWRGIREDIL